MLLAYAFVKFVIYCGVCFVLLPLFRLRPNYEGNFIIAWAGARLLIGLLFAIPLALAYAFLQHSGLSDAGSYAVAFGSSRLAEWSLLFAMLKRKHAVHWGPKAFAWIVFGTIASAGTDGLVLLYGIDNLKYFC